MDIQIIKKAKSRKVILIYYVLKVQFVKYVSFDKILKKLRKNCFVTNIIKKQKLFCVI